MTTKNNFKIIQLLQQTCKCWQPARHMRSSKKARVFARRPLTPLGPAAPYPLSSAGSSLKREFLSEVHAPDISMRHHILRRPLHQYLAIMHDVGTIDNLQRFTDIMITNEHPKPTIPVL